MTDPMTSVPPTQPPAADETDVRLTADEREAWDVDPDLWPHTPPLHIFRALMDEDDNLWWRASGGHGLNAYDAATERIDELEERVRVVEGERDRWESTAYYWAERAESAEAARAALVAAVKALADLWESTHLTGFCSDGCDYLAHGNKDRFASDLKAALLAGGAR